MSNLLDKLPRAGQVLAMRNSVHTLDGGVGNLLRRHFVRIETMLRSVEIRWYWIRR